MRHPRFRISTLLIPVAIAAVVLFVAGMIDNWPWPSGGSAQEQVKLDAAPESQESRDAAVLHVVLDDLLSWPNSPLLDHEQIFCSPDISDDRLVDSDVAVQHRLKQRWKLSPVQLGIAREAAVDALRHKNVNDIFKILIPKDKRIVIYDEARETKDRAQPRHHRTQVFRIIAPGYSQDHRFAIVYLTYPSGYHAGSGSYGLVRKEGKWVILYRDLLTLF